ncbi:MAG: hypothetical protein V2A72_02670 [Candidatus Omnitrophota bacterium]
MKCLIFSTALNIRPITGPIGFFQSHRVFVTAAVWVLFFLFLSLIFFIARKVIKNRPVYVVYPDELALKRLKDLFEPSHKEGAEIKEIFVKIADVLCEYIEKRYEIKISKMTTQQFIGKLGGVREISAKDKEFIIEMLKKKDSVKFAGAGVSKEELTAASGHIKQFILSTKQKRQ